jgi:hypothetical protein
MLCRQLVFFAVAALPLLLVLCRCSNWLALTLCRYLASFALAALLLLCMRCACALPSWQMAFFALAALPLRLCRRCLCFAVLVNGSSLCFAISLHSLPSRLCRCCTCIALVCLRCGKWLVLAHCLQLAFFALTASPLWLWLLLMFHHQCHWLLLVLCRELGIHRCGLFYDTTALL